MEILIEQSMQRLQVRYFI